MLYLPDSNALITPLQEGELGSLHLGLHSRHPSDVRDHVQALSWLETWFERGFMNGCLVAIEELLQEVGRKQDAASRLLARLKARQLIRLLEPTDVTFDYLARIEQFVREKFTSHQADEFLKSSDPMFIALAKTHGATLITLERHSIPQYNGTTGKIQGKTRVPYVAWVFGVRCISLYQALDEVDC